MYKLEVTVEEIKPGVLAFKARPFTDQTTTDNEMSAGELVNESVSQLIETIGQCSGDSQLMTGKTSEVMDQAFEAQKEAWRQRPDQEDGPTSSRN